MIDHHIYPDPGVRELLETSLGHLGQTMARISAGAGSGAAAAPAAASDIDLDAIEAAFERMCAEQEWLNGLVLGTRLFLAQPHRPRTAYLLGSCMQRLGNHQGALGLFSHCKLLQEDRPAPGPLFRIGECLAALKQRDQALEAFESAIELARSDSSHADIFALATGKYNALRALH